jgi:ribosomal protein S18 acetylase RimI-like enzyme
MTFGAQRSKAASAAVSSHTLRPAGPEDYQWLWELKRLTMRPYVELTWGHWDDAIQEQFFKKNFSSETVQIISVNGQDAGLLNVEREPAEIFLANLQIHPSFQNRGLGSAILHELLDSARALRLPIRLQVLRVNGGAARLYARFGFTVYTETATHFLMRWQPS